MSLRIFALTLTLCLAACATSQSTSTDSGNGLVELRSAHSVERTTARLQAALDKAGMKQFATIDHAAGAKAAGLSLRPTRVVIFGNPKAGTPLMRCAQTVGIDLPMKALIYTDADGQVWYAYNDPAYLASRHAIEGCDAVISRISGALAKFASAATGG